MRALTLDDIVSREHYERVRDAYRTAVIAHKRSRRLPVGEQITLVFEDRETLRFQVQEMLWVEGIGAPEKIQHELDTYNDLMPGDGELSATLFIEITQAREIRPALDRLVGVDEHVSLLLGGEPTLRVRAQFDPKQLEDDRISAVQYIRFALDADALARFCDPACPARIAVDHPNYDCAQVVDSPVRRSLIGGLVDPPASLLPADPGPAAVPTDDVVFENATLRVIAPLRPIARGHRIVEPVAPVASLLEAEESLQTQLLAAVRSTAADVVREHGTCRVHTDLGGHATRLRWHVYAP